MFVCCVLRYAHKYTLVFFSHKSVCFWFKSHASQTDHKRVGEKDFFALPTHSGGLFRSSETEGQDLEERKERSKAIIRKRNGVDHR